MDVENGILKNVKYKDIDFLNSNPDDFWKGVEKIGRDAFSNNEDLEEITIPASINRIGSFAFYGCVNLKKVILNEGLGSIGSFAFIGCQSLEEIIIPASVVELGVSDMGCGIFMGCKNLNKITFKNKNNFPTGLTDFLDDFKFDSFETNGDEVTFIRNVEKEKNEENE